MRHTIIAGSLALAVVCSAACGEPATTSEAAAPAAAPAKAAHVFHGKVEQVDATTKTLSVNGENVEGWMAAMTMTYKASNPEIFDSVMVGDQIAAKVYDGDFATLHDVASYPDRTPAVAENLTSQFWFWRSRHISRLPSTSVDFSESTESRHGCVTVGETK